MGIISRRKKRRPSGRPEDIGNIHANDRSILMTTFLMKIVGLWLARDEKEQRIRHLTLLYTVVAIVFGTMVEVRDFYYSWPNFSDCAYISCNIMCLVMVLLKLFVVSVNKNKFMCLLMYTQKNFWHNNYNRTEKALLARCKRVCTIALAVINSLAQGSVCSYIVGPIVANIGKNESDRILPFNTWVDLPLSISPYYEITFTIQVLSLYHVAICYVCFDNLLCLLNLHTATQFRILQYRFKTLTNTVQEGPDDPEFGPVPANFAEECYKSFTTCIRQHQSHILYSAELESIFTGIVLAHVLFFSLVMCLVGYQIFLAESTTARRCIFIFHITGSLCQIILFTYSCHGLMEESSNVGLAAYSGPWIHLSMNRTGKVLRNDLQIVMLRSKHPCCLTAYGFFPVSLETCTKVLSTAMSYFTLMRNSVD